MVSIGFLIGQQLNGQLRDGAVLSRSNIRDARANSKRKQKIEKRQAANDRLGQWLLDANRDLAIDTTEEG